MKTIEKNGITFKQISESHYMAKDKYNIRYAGMADYDDNTSIWKCDCPAGKHGMDCKHLKTFLQIVAMFDDED